MNKTIDSIEISQEYADWVTAHAHEFNLIVCNGDTLLEAMSRDDVLLAYLRHIDYDGDDV